MKEYLRSTIKSSFCQVSVVKLVLGILMMTVLVFISSIDSLIRFFRETSMLAHNYHRDFLISAFGTDTVISFIPILAVLPFSGVYVDDVKSKFARFTLIRTNFCAYIISRCIVCFLCGGTVIGGGAILAWLCAAAQFIPLEQLVDSPNDSTNILMEICVLMLINGGFWSMVGMAMSTLMESKYISYATPFVFYYLLVILYERYFSDLFIIYPKTWTDPTVWPFGCWGAAIFLLEMTLIFAFFFAYRAGRRLQQI